MKKKLFAILLSLAMIVTMMPAMTMTAYADIIDSLNLTYSSKDYKQGVINWTEKDGMPLENDCIVYFYNDTEMVYALQGGTWVDLSEGEPEPINENDVDFSKVNKAVYIIYIYPESGYSLGDSFTLTVNGKTLSKFEDGELFNGEEGYEVVEEGGYVEFTIGLVETIGNETSNWPKLADAMTGSQGTVDGAFKVENKSGVRTITLLSNITAGADDSALVVPDGKKVVLDLNGYVLDRGLIAEDGTATTVDHGSVIENQGELTITDSNSGKQEHKFKILEGHKPWVLDEDNGTRTVSGGVITGGTGYRDLLLYGAGIYNENGKLYLKDGNIVGNAAPSSANTDGGGISGGDVTIESGSIKGNASMTGAAVSSKTLLITGGKISQNIAYFGAVYVLDSMKMTGGEISNNTARQGGGINGEGEPTFELVGGSIKNNHVDNTGPFDPPCAGGIKTSSGNFILGGSLVVKGNTRGAGNIADDFYYESGSTVKLADGTDPSIPAPKSGFKVGLRTPGGQESNLKILQAKSDQEKYFFSNDENFRVKYNSGAYLELGPVPLCEIGDTGYDSIQDAIAACPDNTETIIKLNKDMALDAPVKILENKNININLNGHNIDRGLTEATTDGYVIKVNESGTLTIVDNSSEKNGKITGGYNNGNGGAIVVDNGTLNILGGIIGNSKCSNQGGAIYTMGNASVNMTDGVISNCSSKHNGGGVFINGDCKFTMSGGTIDDCHITENGSGGAVFSVGSFDMTGGTLENCSVSSGSGGGVFSDKKMTLSGDAVIKNCVANADGGGVLIRTEEFIMTGGTIENCRAGRGGGVAIFYRNNGGKFSMSDGIIRNNTATSTGGGVYCDGGVPDGNVTLGGKAVVRDNKKNEDSSNLYIPSGKKISILDPEEGMSVGITLADDTGQFTTNGASTDTRYFNSDNPNYYVNFNSDHLELLAPTGNTHIINFELNGNGTIYADKQAAVPGDSVTLTIVPDENYELYPAESFGAYDNNAHKKLDLTANPDGTYTFVMPNGSVNVNANFREQPKYMKADGTFGHCKTYKNLSGGETTLGEDGKETWYVIEGGKKFDDQITLQGDVSIVQIGGYSSEINNTINLNGHTLNIYGVNNEYDNIPYIGCSENFNSQSKYVIWTKGVIPISGGGKGGKFVLNSGFVMLAETHGYNDSDDEYMGYETTPAFDTNVDVVINNGAMSVNAGSFISTKGTKGTPTHIGGKSLTINDCEALHLIAGQCTINGNTTYTSAIDPDNCEVTISDKLVLKEPDWNNGGALINATSLYVGNIIFLNGNPVCIIDGKEYGSLLQAINSISDNGTIKLTEDTEGVVKVGEEKTFTIDSNGYENNVSVQAEDGYSVTSTDLGDGKTQYTVKKKSSGNGGGGGTEPEKEKQDDSGKDGKVPVNANVENGKAKVDEIPKEDIEKAAKQSGGHESGKNSIIVDLSQQGSKVTAAELTRETLNNIEEVLESKNNPADSVKVKLSDSTIEMGQKTFKSINDQSRGKTVEFGVEKTSENTLNRKQQEAISNLDVFATYDAYVKSGDHRISEFDDGYITITIEINPAAGTDASKYQIYSIREDGSMFAFAADVSGGKITFKTNRLLDYLVLYDAASKGRHKVFIAKAKSVKKNRVRLKWRKVKGATSYTIYGARCGKRYKKIRSVRARRNKCVIKRVYGKKLKPHKIYKFYIAANTPNGREKCKTIYFITKRVKGKYANVRKVTANKKRIVVRVGKRKKIKVRYKVFKNKAHLGRGFGRPIRYYSSNKWIARVGKRGRVKGVNPGVAYIFAQDIGGRWCKVKVRVK